MLLYYVYISFCSLCYAYIFKACEKKANRRTPLFPNRRLGQHLYFLLDALQVQEYSILSHPTFCYHSCTGTGVTHRSRARVSSMTTRTARDTMCVMTARFIFVVIGLNTKISYTAHSTQHTIVCSGQPVSPHALQHILLSAILLAASPTERFLQDGDRSFVSCTSLQITSESKSN